MHVCSANVRHNDSPSSHTYTILIHRTHHNYPLPTKEISLKSYLTLFILHSITKIAMLLIIYYARSITDYISTANTCSDIYIRNIPHNSSPTYVSVLEAYTNTIGVSIELNYKGKFCTRVASEHHVNNFTSRSLVHTFFFVTSLRPESIQVPE